MAKRNKKDEALREIWMIFDVTHFLWKSYTAGGEKRKTLAELKKSAAKFLEKLEEL